MPTGNTVRNRVEAIVGNIEMLMGLHEEAAGMQVDYLSEKLCFAVDMMAS